MPLVKMSSDTFGRMHGFIHCQSLLLHDMYSRKDLSSLRHGLLNASMTKPAKGMGISPELGAVHMSSLLASASMLSSYHRELDFQPLLQPVLLLQMLQLCRLRALQCFGWMLM